MVVGGGGVEIMRALAWLFAIPAVSRYGTERMYVPLVQ